MARDPLTDAPNVRFGTLRHTSLRSTQLDRTGADWLNVNGRMSRLYLIAGALAVLCYLVVPGLAGNTLLFELVSASAAVAITRGVIRYQPRPLLPWVLFIVAQVLFLAGDFFYYTFDLDFPAPADALYLAYYPLQAIGLVLVIRARNPVKDSAGLLDALIIAIGFGLPSWVYLIEPYTRDSTLSVVSSLVSIAYPVMDVLLLSVAARLLMGGGNRPRAFYLLIASIGALVVTDAAYGAIELHGNYDVGSSLDVGWMVSYLLWGAAVLHPSMRDVSTRGPDRDASLTPKRIVSLACASLIGPTMIAVNNWRPIDGFDLPVVLVASGIMFLLTLARVVALAASLHDAIARHERGERRETILRQVATTLTAASDREYVRLAALEGATALVRDLPSAQVVVDLHSRAETLRVKPGAEVRDVVISLATRASPYGRLVLTSATPVPTDIIDGLGTLGAQVALALEAVALTEDLSKQRSETRVGALVQNSTDMIMVVDADFVIRYVTPSVAQTLGHRPEELVGRSATSLAEPGEQALVREFYEGMARHPGKSVTAEWRMKRVDGGYTEFEAVVCNLLANPSVQGIVVTAHDITDRKALEDGLKRQVQELEELDRLRTDFVATVSHELRTPLTNIIGEVELLEDGDRGELTSCQAHGVDVINRNSGRLLTLIEDLLALGRIESSVLELHCKPTLVANLVEGVGNRVSPAADAKSVTLEIDYGTNSGVIVADPVQLDRALLNLLNNAVKFTPAGGRAALHVGRVGDNVEFTVSDNGIGIPEAEQVRLFTRFFRSSEATRLAIQGTGLGLVIVKRIVEAHGGTVSIVSKPNVGTTVTVRLPAGDRSEFEVGAA